MSIALGLTEEQRAVRRSGITATDIPALLGVDLYRTEWDVYLEKIGQADERELSQPAEWGLRLQRLIAERRMEAFGDWKLEDPGTMRHRDNPIMLATPDYIAATIDSGAEERWALECKAPGLRQAWRFGPEGTDELPEEYIAQQAWQLAVADLPRGEVCVLIGGQDFRVYPIARDRELEGALVDLAARWWRDHIVAGKPPALDGSTAADSWLRKRFPSAGKNHVQAPTEALAYIEVIREARAAKEAADIKERGARQVLQMMIGEASGFIGDGWRATWSDVKPSSYTVNRKGGRQFRVTFANEKPEE